MDIEEVKRIMENSHLDTKLQREIVDESFTLKVKDESSGPSLVKDERYSIWQDGYVAGWNEAKAIVAKVNAEAGDIRVFERMILAAFILTQGQGLIGNDD